MRRTTDPWGKPPSTIASRSAIPVGMRRIDEGSTSGGRESSGCAAASPVRAIPWRLHPDAAIKSFLPCGRLWQTFMPTARIVRDRGAFLVSESHPELVALTHQRDEDI